MYGPGPFQHYPYYPPPQSGVVYVPVPTPTKGKGGRKGFKHNGPVDILASIQKTKQDIENLEKLFKKEEKKDDKPKGRTFTLLETIALNFIVGLPMSFMLFLVFKSLAKL